jgi:hypothetical protein
MSLDLPRLTWHADERYGEVSYRMSARRGVLRNYRRRPTKFLAEIVVCWGYNDPFRALDETLAALNAMPIVEDDDGDRQPEYHKLNFRFRDLRDALKRLPHVTYLASGVAGERPHFELLRTFHEQRVPIFSRSPMSFPVEPREQAERRLTDCLHAGWSPMLAATSVRYFRALPKRLVNQMVYDKMAYSDWPVA